MKTSNSQNLFTRAKDVLVGGVNSPVRAFGGVGGVPRFIERAHGPYLIDVDGNQYIDFVGSWGPMILGHANRKVLEAVKKRIDRGTSFGATSPIEVELAQLVRDAYPSMEQIRFTSSGTEATMSALRLARAATRRDRIVKFEGGYHGHSDGLLVAAGSGATTFGIPSSPGVPELLARNTWVLPFNDISALEAMFRTQGPNIAAVIVEPVCGNMGVVPPAKGFLEKLRLLTRRYGALLIFDEVMTGFRVAWGGAQSIYGVTPDITCLGKIIGGGFPVGAFGASEEIMQLLAPVGPVYQAGTLSGNPVAMEAGVATLKTLKSKNPYKWLNSVTKDLVSSIQKSALKRRIAVEINQIGSMFTIFFCNGPVRNYFDATHSSTERYAAFFHALLDRGVYMPPSQFEAAFVSTAHDRGIMNKAKSIFDHAFEELSRRKGNNARERWHTT